MLRFLPLTIGALAATTSMGAGISGPLPAEAAPVGAPGSGSHPFVILENAGQFDPAVRFQVQTSREVIWVTDQSLWVTQFLGGRQAPSPSDAALPGNDRSTSGPTKGINLKLTFPGHRVAALIASDPVPAWVNYFLGSDPRKWRSGVHGYGRVTWRNLYPGVSLSLAKIDGEAALVVKAVHSSDLSAVRLAVTGAKALRALPGGRLVADTDIGPVPLPALVEDGRSLEAHPRGRVVSFTDAGGSTAVVPEAEPRMPSEGSGLLYGTFLGGGTDDETSDIAIGPDGSTYVAGWTYSADFPTTLGAFDTTNADRDGFITRVDPSGGSLIYSTYLEEARRTSRCP